MASESENWVGKLILGLGNHILGGILGLVTLALLIPYFLLGGIIRLVSKLTQNSNLAFQIKAIHMAFIYGFKGENFLQKIGNALKFIARLLLTFVAQTIITIGALSIGTIFSAIIIAAASGLLAVMLVVAAPILAIAIGLGTIIGVPGAFVFGVLLGATNLLGFIAEILQATDQTFKQSDVIENYLLSWRTDFVFAPLNTLEEKHEDPQHHLRYPYLMLSTTILLSITAFVLTMTIPALTPILLAASPVFLTGFSTIAIGGVFSGVILLTGIIITTAAVLLNTCLIKDHVNMLESEEPTTGEQGRRHQAHQLFPGNGARVGTAYHRGIRTPESSSDSDDSDDEEVQGAAATTRHPS